MRVAEQGLSTHNPLLEQLQLKGEKRKRKAGAHKDPRFLSPELITHPRFTGSKSPVRAESYPSRRVPNPAAAMGSMFSGYGVDRQVPCPDQADN